MSFLSVKNYLFLNNNFNNITLINIKSCSLCKKYFYRFFYFSSNNLTERKVNNVKNNFDNIQIESQNISETNNSVSDNIKSASGVLSLTINALKRIPFYFPKKENEVISTSLQARQLKTVPPDLQNETKIKIIKDKLHWNKVDQATRYMINKVKSSVTLEEKLDIIKDLSNHFISYPRARAIAINEDCIKTLLKVKKKLPFTKGDPLVINSIFSNLNKVLAILGHVKPISSKGIRILALDGGGTRGIITLSILRQIEKLTRQPLHHTFDYICGVSTGALIGVIATSNRLPLYKIEDVYKHFSKQMFVRNKLIGVGKFFMSHAYYDTELWEHILRKNIGEKSFLDLTVDEKCPKLAVVSTLMNYPRVQNFLFRNYNYEPTRYSKYEGSMNYKLWHAIRASSAAPGYFEEFELDGLIHQDGGLLANNPTAIALHECNLIWPNEKIQCIVSIGTGKFEVIKQTPGKSSLKSKITKVIESATDTEGVHRILHDLLPPYTYFRFNPYLSEGFELDETRELQWQQMLRDTYLYCRKNEYQLDRAGKQLLLEKNIFEKVKELLVNSLYSS